MSDGYVFCFFVFKPFACFYVVIHQNEKHPLPRKQAHQAVPGFLLREGKTLHDCQH